MRITDWSVSHDLEALRLYYARWSRRQAAEWAGVSARTWRRWEAGRAPILALRALRMRCGDLGALAGAWAGWTLCPRDDRLYSADLAHGWTPGDVMSLHWERQMVWALRLEVRELRRRLALVTSANDAAFAAYR